MSEKKITVLDTTLRDGALQPGIYYTPIQRLEIAEMLAEVGTPRIEFEITYPQRGGKIQDVREAIDKLQGKYDKVTTIVQCRAYRPDLEIAGQFDAGGCAIYLAVSEEHRKHKLKGMSIDAVVDRFVDSLYFLKEYGFEYRRAVLEDSSRFFSQYRGQEDIFENFSRVVKAVDEAGATTISIPDTSGILIPDQARHMFKSIRSITKKELSAHFHNDYGNSLANALAVLEYADEVHVSIQGLAARNGITDHWEFVANCVDNLGIEIGENREKLMELYTRFEEITGIPFYWRNCLSTNARGEKAGTHQAQQVKSATGYIPKKKLAKDFRGEILFEVGQSMSKHVVKFLLDEYHLDGVILQNITSTVLGASSLKGRRLSPQEVREIIRIKSNVDVPLSELEKVVFGPARCYIFIKTYPQYPGDRIVREVRGWNGIIAADEVYGKADIVVLTRLKDGEGTPIVDRIRDTFKEGIMSTETWPVE